MMAVHRAAGVACAAISALAIAGLTVLYWLSQWSNVR